MDQATADLLEQYVKSGGQLNLGCRTGYKDKRGHCWYYGSVFHEQIANEILSRLPELTSPAKWLDLLEVVELAMRSNGAKKYYILLNYSEEAVTAHAQKLVRNLLDGSTVQGSIQLEGYDVLLLEDIE